MEQFENSHETIRNQYEMGTIKNNKLFIKLIGKENNCLLKHLKQFTNTISDKKSKSQTLKITSNIHCEIEVK